MQTLVRAPSVFGLALVTEEHELLSTHSSHFEHEAPSAVVPTAETEARERAAITANFIVKKLINYKSVLKYC